MSSDVQLIAAMRANKSFLASVDELIASTNKFLVGGAQSSVPNDPQAFFASFGERSVTTAELNALAEALPLRLGVDTLSFASASQASVLQLFSSAVERYKETGSAEVFYRSVEAHTGPLLPAARWVLIYFFLPMLISILANLATGPVQEALSHKQPTQHATRTSTETQASPDIRFALSEGVRIRKEASAKSEVVSRLHRGQVVRVLKAENRWLLISVKSEETEVVGWTYSSTLGIFIVK